MARKRAATKVKSPVTWILVADARQAQVYNRRKAEKLIAMKGNSGRNHFEELITHEPVPVRGMKWHAESVEQYEASRKKMGVIFRNISNVRSRSANPQEKIRLQFAKLIAENLNKAVQKRTFNRLVLIGPAKMLVDIKKHLNDKALKQVVAEMPKDIVPYNEHGAGRASG